MNTLIPMNHQQPSEEDTIMEIKETFMLSPAGDSETTFRTAHFLKPIANSIHELTYNHFNLNPSSSSSVFESKKCPFKIKFKGWRYPKTKWVKWVDQLKPKYESVWKKAGIFDPIMSTKSHIMKNQDLVYGVVEKWCSETNTFVFPFGEATITLEDVMVLGGYSLFGDPVFTTSEDKEMGEAEQKLIIARQEMTIEGNARTLPWMNKFIDKGSEIEHEAFLAAWLSIFVFPSPSLLVKSCLFPIAVSLARGNTIALAPTVLASLYNDLSVFKKNIVDLKKKPLKGIKFPLELDVSVQSPIYLVQVWVWERFKNLQPQPKSIKNADHVLLRWHEVKPLKINNVKLALDSTMDDFLWRPYVKYASKYEMFYPKDEILVPLKEDLDKKILSFVIGLRVSELVGFESIEQYLPHRVAMQFGIDQDIPGFVPRFNATETNAWNNYCRPISDTSVYFPSRCSEANVTVRYEKWWKRSASSSKCRPPNATDIPLEFTPPKLVGTVTFGKPCDRGSKTRNGDDITDNDVRSDFSPTLLNTMPFENSGFIPSDAPSSSHPKHNTLTPLISVAEDSNHVLEDVQFKDADESVEAPTVSGTTVTTGKSCGDGSKTSKGDNIVSDDVPSNFVPKLLKTIPSENSVQDGLKAGGNIDAGAPSSLPPKLNILTPLISPENCKDELEDVEFKYGNESEEASLSNERIRESETQDESYSDLCEVAAELEQRVSRLERMHRERKMARMKAR